MSGTQGSVPDRPDLPGQSSLDRQVVAFVDGEWVLRGARDPGTGQVWYPPPVLGRESLAPAEEVTLGTTGTLYSAVEVHVGPVGFEAPYWAGYVDLPEGVRVFGRISCGDQTPEPGMTLEIRVGVVRTDPTTVIGPIFVLPGAPC